MIGNHTFFGRSVVVEAGRPSFEAFEAEREGILPWRESTALVDHDFGSCKLVPGLIIGHSVISIG